MYLRMMMVLQNRGESKSMVSAFKKKRSPLGILFV